MAAMEFLCRLWGVNPQFLTYQEKLILEAELFVRICEELKDHYRNKNKEYLSLMNVNRKKEAAMLEANFLKFVIQDILMTEEYSIFGIAHQTQIPVDVICDLASGKNKTPSLQVSRKIIELHKTVRTDLYEEVIKKIKEAL